MAKEKFYITKQRLKELKGEYKDLLDFEHRKTEGDAPRIFQSEDINPEYLSFQEDLSFLRARKTELANILENYELIKPPVKEKQKVICLGAKVKVGIDGDKDEFEIVGTLEANPSLGKISNESPVGKALMGRKIGDEVVLSSPVKTVYKIIKIKYN